MKMPWKHCFMTRCFASALRETRRVRAAIYVETNMRNEVVRRPVARE
jgi:hypothetical protein